MIFFEFFSKNKINSKVHFKIGVKITFETYNMVKSLKPDYAQKWRHENPHKN